MPTAGWALPPHRRNPESHAMSPGVERRSLDRRRSDRRAPPRATSDEAWLSAWGDPGRPAGGAALDGDGDGDGAGGGAGYGAGGGAGVDVGRGGASGGHAHGRGPATDPGDTGSGFALRPAGQTAYGAGPRGSAALPRILRTYIAARAALGVALVLVPWLGSWVGGHTRWPVMALCLAYAGLVVSMWVLHEHDDPAAPDQLMPRQWLWTIGVDLLAFSALRLIDPLGQLNYAALLVLPVLMSGVLTQRRVALATAAGVTLLLLGGAWVAAAQGGDLLAQLSQAGLAGAGMFMVILVSSELTQRLVREERTARSSLETARQQTLLNRLVIEEMADGVLVVDRRGRVRAVNPAARNLLGSTGQRLAVLSALADQPTLRALHDALESAYRQGSWPESARSILIDPGDGEARSLQVRARFTRRGGIGANDTPPEDICVLFLEDARAVQARARQDKLAAMGRMSAGIAHEIRNPLAAIAQANALLLEDDLAAPQRQLAAIVGANVWRLKRIVDDVLAVAPGTAASPTVISLVAEVVQVCDDWCHAAAPATQAAARLARLLPDPHDTPLPVLFDAEHLRRVMVNLLDNAARHAGPLAGAMQLRIASGPAPGTVRLTLASDGPPIAPEVERHLFEPFFSTRARGSGLGLYICRELCERHSAAIDFGLAPPGARHRNVFAITLRNASAP